MSKKLYRIAAIGFAHAHMRMNLEAFASCKDRVVFVAAADVKPRISSISEQRSTRIAGLHQAVNLYGFKKYDDYNRLLDENKIDIALVCSENAFHPQVSEILLQKGIHVVLEKPMAADMSGALRITHAKGKSNAHVYTNWPSAWNNTIRKAKKMTDEGVIGRLYKFTYRNGDSLGPFSYGQTLTDKEKSLEWWYQSDVGGGAMLDYCSYGACMSCWFINQHPIEAFGLKANYNSPYGNVEDYATITVRFPSSVAILEGSWTTINTGIEPGPILFGTEGTMVVKQSGQLYIYKTRHKKEPDLIIEPEPLPIERNNLGKEILYHLDTGGSLFPMLDLELNLEAMSILDAGSRSANTKKMEAINNIL